MESNNSFLINAIATTVVLWGVVTLVVVPQINIFAPDNNQTNNKIVVEKEHDTAPIEADKIVDIINDQAVLQVQNLTQEDSKQPSKPEKRVKQPDTYYRCVNPITGKPIEHGKTIITYEKSSVKFPETCKQEIRKCDNGTMLWSYTETSCTQVWDGCVWPDWRNYSHGSVGTYYLYGEVIWKKEDGEDICTRQARVCQWWSRYLFNRQTKSDFTYKYPHCNVEVQ